MMMLLVTMKILMLMKRMMLQARLSSPSLRSIRSPVQLSFESFVRTVRFLCWITLPVISHFHTAVERFCWTIKRSKKRTAAESCL